MSVFVCACDQLESFVQPLPKQKTEVAATTAAQYNVLYTRERETTNRYWAREHTYTHIHSQIHT